MLAYNFSTGYFIPLFIILIFLEVIICPPVRPTQEKNSVFNDLHYKDYLQEIIKELEADEKFSEAIKSAQGHNRTDHISHSLSFVNHRIRSKLDEIKRREIERLIVLEQEVTRRKLEAQGEKVPIPNAKFDKIISTDKEHLDHSNPHTFETEDLQKLIRKTEKDLQMVDEQQEEVYKEHEMKKDYLKKQKIERAKDVKEKEKLQKEFDESEKRHEHHEKVHHPGNQEQLKEVWEKIDHLDSNDFNPSAFFDLHDINGDGLLDINEVEALMQTELSKVYDGNNTDDDLQERYHEMMRMRKEMMKLIDKDGDNLISKPEFIEYSKSSNFKDDEEWKTQEEIDKKPYSDQEYKDFVDSYRNEEEDEFSDQDESLRYHPREFATPSPSTPPGIQKEIPDGPPHL